jgi:hypothetical protein
MRPTSLFVLAILSGLSPGALPLAQEPPQPPALRLPLGARVRVRTAEAPGGWIQGTLVSASSAGVGLLPDGAPPIVGSEFRLPREAVARLELATGKKRHWLHGLIIGAAAGLAMGAAFDVDPVRCEFDDNYFCSRGEAVAASGFAVGGIGALVGSLVKTDVWTPVAMDALAPPAPAAGRLEPQLRVVPGGVFLNVSVGF